MSTDKKPEDQVTEAGAVELEEDQLDQASGGLSLAAEKPTPPLTQPKYKIQPFG